MPTAFGLAEGNAYPYVDDLIRACFAAWIRDGAHPLAYGYGAPPLSHLLAGASAYLVPVSPLVAVSLLNAVVTLVTLCILACRTASLERGAASLLPLLALPHFWWLAISAMGEPTYFAFMVLALAAVARQCEAPSARNATFAGAALVLFSASRFEAWAVGLAISAAPLASRWLRGEPLIARGAHLALPVAALAFPASWLIASELRFGAWNFSLKAFSDLHRSLLANESVGWLLRRVFDAHSVGTLALLAGGVVGVVVTAVRAARARKAKAAPDPHAVVASMCFAASFALYLWTIASRTMVFPHERFATAVAFSAVPLCGRLLGDVWESRRALRAPVAIAVGVLLLGSIPSWRARPSGNALFPFDLLQTLERERAVPGTAPSSWTATVMPEGAFDSVPNLLMATDLDRRPLFWQSRWNAARDGHEPVPLPVRIDEPQVLILPSGMAGGTAAWLALQHGENTTTATLMFAPTGGSAAYREVARTERHSVLRRER